MIKEYLGNVVKETETYKVGVAILNDFKKLCKIFKYGSLVFTAVYFIVALILQIGNVIANSILATLFVAYTIFDFVASKKNIKKTKKIVKRSYKWVKIAIRAFTLASMIYGIYIATTAVSAISIIIATLTIIMWVLQVMIEIVIEVIEDKWELLYQSIQKDIAGIKENLLENAKEMVVDYVKQTHIYKTVETVGGVIQKIKNKDNNDNVTVEVVTEKVPNDKQNKFLSFFKKKNKQNINENKD